MEDNKLSRAINNCKEEISKFNRKTFKVMFLVYDTKGVPSGSLTYIYKIAYVLKKEGYDVKMLHTEPEFIGVGDWLGDKYASLPHVYLGSKDLSVSPSDFFFIPEIFAQVMNETSKLPCKRIVIMQNYDFMTELIPNGLTWKNYGIDTFITTSDKLGNKVKDVFPETKYYTLPPFVDKQFSLPEDNFKLTINIITKDGGDINAIVKPFIWKYPIYGFVSFKRVSGLSKEEFAQTLKNSPITIWNDPFTDFGISAVEAMACGNIVIGKIPESEPEWLIDSNSEIKNNGLWYYNNNDVHSLIAKAIQTYLYDLIPEEFEKSMSETVNTYSEDKFIQNVKELYIGQIFKERENEFRTTLQQLINKQENKNE